MKHNRMLMLTVITAALTAALPVHGGTILVRPARVNLQPGDYVHFEAQAYGEGNVPVDIEQYEWKVTPEDLGRITDDGFFVAGRRAARGTVTASAQTGGQTVSGRASVVIGNPPEPHVRLVIRPGEAVVPPGGQQAFSAVAVGADGVSLRIAGVRWQVNPPDLGEIDRLGVFHAGRRAARGAVMALADIEGETVRGEAKVVVSPPANSGLSGTISDESGAAIEGARVTAIRLGIPSFTKQVETGADGRFLIENLIPGQYILRAESRGYRFEYYDDEHYLREADPIALGADEVVDGLAIVLDRGARLSGRVDVLVDGAVQPLGGAHIVAFSPLMPLRTAGRYHTLTQPDGQFTLEGLPSGSFFVAATKSGYLDEFYDDAKNLLDADAVELPDQGSVTGIDFVLEITSAVTGTVTDEAGDPVEDARIFAVPARGRQSRGSGQGRDPSGRSDASGRYTIQLPPGSYLLCAEARGYTPEWYENSADRDGAAAVEVLVGIHTTADFELVPLGSISGVVLDALANEPVPSARVQVFNERRGERRHFTTRTDESGAYRFAALPAGDYVVKTTARGYLEQYYDGAGTVAEAMRVTVAPGVDNVGVDFALHQGGSLAGTVIDEATGEKLAGAVMDLAGLDNRVRCTVRSEENGGFEFTGLPSGNYAVRAVRHGYEPMWYDGKQKRSEADPVLVTALEPAAGIDFALKARQREGGRISGRVTEQSAEELPAEQAAALEGALVTAIPLTFARMAHAVSGPDGFYELSGLAAGKYVVVCRARGYIGEYYPDAHHWSGADVIIVPEGGAIEAIHFALTPQEGGPYMVAGSVRDETGQPVEGAYVAMTLENEVIAAAVSEADGYYEFGDLPAGSYRVSASTVKSASRDAGDANVTVGEGADAIVDLVLALESTGVDAAAGPRSYALEQNYPNPFNPGTEIRFSLAARAEVRLVVYNILGKQIRVLLQGMRDAGSHTAVWDGRDRTGAAMASGYYFYRLSARAGSDTYTATRRMVLLR